MIQCQRGARVSSCRQSCFNSRSVLGKLSSSGLWLGFTHEPIVSSLSRTLGMAMPLQAIKEHTHVHESCNLNQSSYNQINHLNLSVSNTLNGVVLFGQATGGVYPTRVPGCWTCRMTP